MSNAAAASTTEKPSLAAQVRDSLVLNEGLIVECVNEVLAFLPAHKAEYFKRQLKDNKALGAAIKRVTVDVGVVLSLAKSFDSDDEFAESAGLMHEIRFSAHDGAVGKFAQAMVECDLASVQKAANGDLLGDDAVLYDIVPADVLERRLRLLLAFVDQKMKSSH